MCRETACKTIRRPAASVVSATIISLRRGASLVDAAVAAGFYDQRHFTTVFREMFGLTLFRGSRPRFSELTGRFRTKSALVPTFLPLFSPVRVTPSLAGSISAAARHSFDAFGHAAAAGVLPDDRAPKAVRIKKDLPYLTLLKY